MFCRHNILGSLNCIIETIQVNDACKYFAQGPHADQPCLRDLSARFIHSEDCVRLSERGTLVVEGALELVRTAAGSVTVESCSGSSLAWEPASCFTDGKGS